MPCEALSAPSTATSVEANAKTYQTSTLLIATHLHDLLKEIIPELVGHQHAHLFAQLFVEQIHERDPFLVKCQLQMASIKARHNLLPTSVLLQSHGEKVSTVRFDFAS